MDENRIKKEGKERSTILQGDDNKVVVVALFKNGVNRCRANRVNGLDVVSVFFRALSRLIDEVCHVKVMDGHVDQNAAVFRGLLDVRRIERRVARRNADNLRTTELSRRDCGLQLREVVVETAVEANLEFHVCCFDRGNHLLGLIDAVGDRLFAKDVLTSLRGSKRNLSKHITS